MRYMKVLWCQMNSKEPALLYSEVDKKNREIRKVDIFRDGSYGYANDEVSIGSTWLGTEPIPSIKDISENNEFIPIEISKAEFEEVWQQALRSRKA